MSQHLSTIGVVATDPKLFTPAGGAEFCTFRLACTERRFDGQKQTWVDGETNWYTVNTFRALAVHAHGSLSKGDRVVLSGRLRVRSWEKDEKRGTSVEIDADGIGHDLRWGTSTFTKRSGQSEPAGSPAPEQTGPEDTRTVEGTAEGTAQLSEPLRAGIQTAAGYSEPGTLEPAAGAAVTAPF